MTVSTPSGPAPSADPQQRLLAWIAAFRPQARAAGIDEATLQAAFSDVRYLPRIIELDRAQPEFTRTVWDYLDTAVSPQRIVRGRERMAPVQAQLDAAAGRYGVPAPVIAAIWGIESNFGSDMGSTPVIDALATLGFDGRREAWARDQLIGALKILQSGDIERSRMVGSWAGAMGHTQFIPSAFLAYAVDADGDGRRDLWASMADVAASTAHFLAKSGWLPGQPWGLEVQLPAGFDPGRADDALRQPAATWADEGVRSMDGTPLPAITQASVFLPAGARGPAFLVGPNFRAILRYNNSTSYALAVGLLAQRLAGGPGVQAAWPRDLQPLTRSQTVALQNALNERGFDSGAADGLLGPATRAALRRWQRSVGLPADGYPTRELLQRLQETPQAEAAAPAAWAGTPASAAKAAAAGARPARGGAADFSRQPAPAPRPPARPTRRRRTGASAPGSAAPRAPPARTCRPAPAPRRWSAGCAASTRTAVR
jgi:membrane-bound lytic murein transglycosylase B